MIIARIFTTHCARISENNFLYVSHLKSHGFNTLQNIESWKKGFQVRCTHNNKLRKV